MKLLRNLEDQPYAQLSPDDKLMLRRLKERAQGLSADMTRTGGKSILDMIQIGQEEGAGAGAPTMARRQTRPSLAQPCRKCQTLTRAKGAVGKNIYRCPNAKCRFVWSGPTSVPIQEIQPVPVVQPPITPQEGGPEWLASGQKSRIYASGKEE